MKLELDLALGTNRVLRRESGDQEGFATRDTHAQIRKEGESTWQTVVGFARRVPDTNRVVHAVEFTGLDQDSNYEIRLINRSIPSVFFTYANDPTNSLVVYFHTFQPLPSGDFTGDNFGSTIYKSYTMPTSIGAGSITVAQVADSHGRESATEIYQQIGNDPDNVRLVIHSGDIATGDGGVGGPATWYACFESFNYLKNTAGYHIPCIPCIGNHEIFGGAGGTQWSSSDVGIKPDFENNIRGDAEWFYAFYPLFPTLRGFGLIDFGDYLTVWILDPGISTLTDAEEDSQTTWFEETLQARQSVPHKFPSFHYSPWPTGRRPMVEYFRTDVRQVWGPIMHENNVRVCWIGHEHVMSYTVPINHWGETDHLTEQVPALPNEGIEFFGSGPGNEVGYRTGRNPATKWWIADSKAREFIYYPWETPEWNGNPLVAETREPHPDDGKTFDAKEVGHYWKAKLTMTSREISAIDAYNDEWVKLIRNADPLPG